MAYATMTTRSAGYVVPASEYNQFIANDEACAVANIQAAGDLFYGTASKAGSRLAKGAYGQVLRINAAATAPEWIGGLTFIQQVVLAADGVISLTAIPGTWKKFVLEIQGLRSTDNTARVPYMKFNNDGGNFYICENYKNFTGTAAPGGTAGAAAAMFSPFGTDLVVAAHNDTAGRNLCATIEIFNPSQTTFNISYCMHASPFIVNTSSNYIGAGVYLPNALAALTQIDLYCNSGDTKFDTGGQAFLYGVV